MNHPRFSTVLVERAEAHEDALRAAGADPALVAQARELVTLTSHYDEAVALGILMLKHGPDAPKIKRRLRERWRITDLTHARAVRQAALPLARRHAHHP